MKQNGKMKVLVVIDIRTYTSK